MPWFTSCYEFTFIRKQFTSSRRSGKMILSSLKIVTMDGWVEFNVTFAQDNAL